MNRKDNKTLSELSNLFEKHHEAFEIMITEAARNNPRILNESDHVRSSFSQKLEGDHRRGGKPLSIDYLKKVVGFESPKMKPLPDELEESVV